jgi:DNA polymerase
VKSEFASLVAAFRGALRWHLETGDAALPVPDGFRTPPLGQARPKAIAMPVEAPRPAAPPPAAALPKVEVADKAAALAALDAESALVTGVGGPDARVVFVTEAPRPGDEEATVLLERMIAAMNLPPGDVHVCRVSWPGAAGDDPPPQVLAACGPFFDRRLSIIEPQVVVAFGLALARWLTGGPGHIARLRGRWLQYGRFPLAVTFHPALLLQDPTLKRPVWDDLKMVMRRLGPDRR